MQMATTNLALLKTYCKGLLEDVNYTDDDLKLIIAQHGNPEADADRRVVDLSMADLLEAVATSLDYTQGEVSRKYDRQALLEVANGLRTKNKDVQISEILGDVL